MDGPSLWEELMLLMEHARSEFGSLRDLPLYGRKQWERYFQKAFQLYARLWTFQQENRYMSDHSEELQTQSLCFKQCNMKIKQSPASGPL